MVVVAFEAELRYWKEHSQDMIVGNNAALTKGTVLVLSDPFTVSGSTSSSETVAGILMRDKIAGDGRTRCPVSRRGIFDMVCSGSIGLGDAVAHAGYNQVVRAAATLSGAKILGQALETGSDAERILIDVNIGMGGNHLS